MTTTFTRRKVLAALGSVGAVYVGSDYAGAALGLDPVDLNQRTVDGTYAQTQGWTTADPPPRVGLSWREIVNGEVQEDTGLTGTTDGETGGVGLIVDEAVMPGDSGSVTMRARLLPADGETADGTANAELYLLFTITDRAENGVDEPEREAGDAPGADGGELPAVTQVTVWEDEGIFTGNNALEPLPVIGDTPIADGSLAEVAGSSELDGDSDANTGGYRIDLDGDTCLSVGDEVYVSFRWEIPSGADNRIQGDSATFRVEFDPRPCP